MPGSVRKPQKLKMKPASGPIQQLFRPCSQSNMAAATQHSEDEPEEGGPSQQQQQEGEDSRRCPSHEEMYLHIKGMFKEELAQAILDFGGQVNELGGRVEELEAVADNLAVGLEENRETIDEHQNRLDNMELQMEDNENRSRKANLRIRGLPETMTDLMGTTSALFQSLIPNVPEEMFRSDDIHRARGKPRNPDTPRDVVLRLHYPEMKNKILSAARPLSALPNLPPAVTIYADLCPPH